MWLVHEKEREEELRKNNEENKIIKEEDGPQEYKISIWTYLRYSTILRGIIIMLMIALIVPVALLLFMDVNDPYYDENHTCSYLTDYRILCGEQNTTLIRCLERKCCFNETDKSCFHTVPSYYQYRILTKKTRAIQTSIESEPIMEKTPFGKQNHKKAYLYYDKIDKETVSITLSENKPPVLRRRRTVPSAAYDVRIFSKEVLAVEVNRTEPNEMLLSTAHGPLIISEKYWEWSVDLEAEHLFGMDFLRHPDNETITRVIYKNAADHTTVPKFIAYRNGSFHALEIYHSGPLEVTVYPSRLIVLRLLAGSYLTLHLSIGPTIDDIMRQQGRGLIGITSLPYWALGVHMCRGGLATNETALHEEFTTTFTFNENIPYDSDCIHEHLFTIAKDVPQIWTDAITALKSQNKRFIMSLSPQILAESPDDAAYKEAEKLGILYRTSSNETLFGNYLNESVVYPDYSTQDAKAWFAKSFSEKFSQLPIDGIVLNDNWAFNNKSIFKDMKREFQYMTEDIAKAMNKTLPWDSLSATHSKHIEDHNLYGFHFASSIPPETPFIVTASHSIQNHFAVHAENVNASWANFKIMLQKSISHSLLSGPLFSMPVCGSTRFFSAVQNQAVCSRWYLAAATMPLFRVSSEIPRRDPFNLNENGTKYMHDLAVNAIQTRYKMLPYYYTVLAEHPMLIRPMFYDFHSDKTSFLLDEQYMIGDSLLVAQPTLFPISNIDVYLPDIPGGWYEFWGGMKITRNGWNKVSIIEGDLVAFIAAGKIIPTQNKVGNSAEESRTNPLKLVIALGEDETASGKYYTANNIIKFNFANDTLKIENVEKCAAASPANPSTGPDDKLINLHLQIYGQQVDFCNVKQDLCLKLNSQVTITTAQHSTEFLVCDKIS